jgi:hypothetical protein
VIVTNSPVKVRKRSPTNRPIAPPKNILFLKPMMLATKERRLKNRKMSTKIVSGPGISP